MLFEMVTLSGPLLRLAEIDAGAREWAAMSKMGKILGSWRTDIGLLGRIILLRAFETAEAVAEERERALLNRNPYNGNGVVETIDAETYRGFHFLPPPTGRKMGGVYEFRTYLLKPGGLQPTLDGWEAAISPAKEYTDHLVINMYALDGRPRITHIWGFESLEQRADLRNRHYKAGLWPPKGGPEQIDNATSIIALSNDGSPLN